MGNVFTDRWQKIDTFNVNKSLLIVSSLDSNYSVFGQMLSLELIATIKCLKNQLHFEDWLSGQEVVTLQQGEGWPQNQFVMYKVSF